MLNEKSQSFNPKSLMIFLLILSMAYPSTEETFLQLLNTIKATIFFSAVLVSIKSSLEFLFS